MDSKIIVALDFTTLSETMDFVSALSPALCKVKVGKGLFTRYGPDLIKRLVELKFDVFLDLKFHDIPSTVASACQAARDLGIWMLNVHAQGGPHMLEAAKKALDGSHTRLIAVTILTSLSADLLPRIGLHGDVDHNVLLLATLANNAGLDGVVCSANECSLLKKQFGKEFLLVTPGIRLLGDKKDCQQRVMSPNKAIASGSDYLVIGRSITQSASPNESLQKIKLDIESLGME